MPKSHPSNPVFLATVIILVAIVGTILVGMASGLLISGPPNQAYNSPIYGRTVFARIYQTYPTGSAIYNRTAGNLTDLQVGDSIAAMRPTYVSGMIRVDHANVVLPSNVVSDYNTIRAIVNATIPSVKFDIVIRTSEYSSGSEISSDMAIIAQEIPFDIFYLDSAGGLSNATLATAITEAHTLGKLIVASWGVSTNYPPPGFDAIESTIPSIVPITVGDLASQLNQINSTAVGEAPSNLKFLQSLKLPLLLQGDNFSPDRGIFIQNFTQTQRIEWMTQSAKLQKHNGFSLMYGILGPWQAPIGTAYNAVNDGALSQEVSLINSNNIKN